MLRSVYWTEFAYGRITVCCPYVILHPPGGKQVLLCACGNRWDPPVGQLARGMNDGRLSKMRFGTTYFPRQQKFHEVA